MRTHPSHPTWSQTTTKAQRLTWTSTSRPQKRPAVTLSKHGHSREEFAFAGYLLHALVDAPVDAEAICEAVARATGAGWWTWRCRSTTARWCWPTGMAAGGTVPRG